jgi:large subunit ribosomal protein L6
MKLINIENLNVFTYKNSLFFASIFGITKIDLTPFLSYIKIIIHKNYIELKNKHKTGFEELNIRLYNEINTKVSYITTVITKKLVLFGIGFRCWTYKTNNSFNCIILKIGFSRDIVVKIPNIIKVISLKPTLILLKSIDKLKLSQFVCFLRSLREPDAYKGKGVQYINEKITLKLGKNS